MTIQELLNQQINAGIIKQRLHPCQFLNQTHKAIAFKTGKIVQTSLPIDIDPTDVVLKDFKESKDNKPNEYMVIPAALYQDQFFGNWNNTFFIIRSESELTYEYINKTHSLALLRYSQLPNVITQSLTRLYSHTSLLPLATS
jgi:hypothetical protein